MVKNIKILRKAEQEIIKKRSRLNYKKSMKIFEGLWKEAVHLGILPSKNPLEGIETDIKLAKILNSCLKKS